MKAKKKKKTQEPVGNPKDEVDPHPIEDPVEEVVDPQPKEDPIEQKFGKPMGERANS